MTIKKSALKTLITLILLIGCVPLLISCRSQSAPQGLVVTVERVVSGQTLEILGTTGQKQLFAKVRLIGIDAPDLQQQPWGQTAKQRLEQMIDGKPVLLESDMEAKDNYGRYLAYLWRDRDLINEQLIAQGYALSAPRSPNTKYNERFARAQERARLLGLGIWDPKQPMRLTPAEFRAQNR